MRLDKILIGIGIFILFIAAGIGVMFDSDGGMMNTYDIDMEEGDIKNLTHDIRGVYNLSSSIDDAVLEQKIEKATGWENMVTGGYQALKSYISTFAIVGNIINVIAITIGVPPIFVQNAMVTFLIIVIFAIIYMIFRFQPRD